MPRETASDPGPSKKSRPGASSGETRRHPRIPIALAVTCTERVEQKRHHWRGRTADVSGGGFAVELPTRLAPGTKLRIEVRTGIGPMRLEAEVLWTRKVAGKSGAFRHGLRLAEGSEVLDLPVSVLLGEWLQKLARDESKAKRAPRRPARITRGRSAAR
jgi:hypothetical protein